MMRFFKFLVYSACFSFCCLNAKGRQSETGLKVAFSETESGFPLVAAGARPVYVDPSEPQVVKIAARALSADVQLVSGIPLAVQEKRSSGSQVIIATLGKSRILEDLISRGKISVSDLRNKWETFRITVVEKPFPGVPQALLILGSDRRGTAFGVFELSRLIGVHPFSWWADVHPDQHKEIYISGSFSSEPPSVKYRGIFLNDEDWGLQPWAAKTFEPETGDIGPKTYSKIFELLLRLKANLIWPAMHPSTKAFYHYPGNVRVADDYAIVIGSSHAEPMLRNNVGEWDEKTMGHFNYLSNKPVVFKYWEDRVKESIGNEVMYTVGMRGVHDSGIEGVKTAREAVPLLERIIDDQRSLLSRYVNRNPAAVPQVFTAYKEVLDIYDNGLKVPEDITLIWPDDNYGYIQRLNNEAEKERTGGSGVYYHASYWGRPHDYLWLSSTHPALIREEMMKAYDTKSDKVWVLNVGDIKPLEYNIQMFMDMAYNVSPFRQSSYPGVHLANWAASIFGSADAAQITSILSKYYELAFERRPEFMGWSQTEPTTQTKYSAYNHFFYGDEAQRRIDAYQSLEDQVKQLRSRISSKDRDAFYQLVYYPVVGASYISKKFLYRDKSFLYGRQHRTSAAEYAQRSMAAYDSIVSETRYYNTQLSGGKWRNIMPLAPRDLPVFKAPVLPAIGTDHSADWGLIPEGWVTVDSAIIKTSAGRLSLPTFNALSSGKYFVDVFLSADKALNWKVESRDKWITISTRGGFLSPEPGKRDVRIWISIDAAKLPAKERLNGSLTFSAGGKKIKVAVPVFNPKLPLKDYAGFVENDGLIAFKAASFSRQIALGTRKWELLPGLGRSSEALIARPLDIKPPKTAEDNIKTNPILEYDFYSFTEAAPELQVFTVPTHPLNGQFSNRFAVSIDNGALKVLDFKTTGRSEEWKLNVLQNQAMRSFRSATISPGRHTLRIYMIDPAVILDRILINLGGMEKAYSIIPEQIFRIEKK